ncbi:MAG: hypothetical protein QM769_11000 [Pseudoxanthomonas sp.]
MRTECSGGGSRAPCPATPRTPTLNANIRPARWLPCLLLVLGSALICALWVLLGLRDGQSNSWMAVVAAADAALLLRLGGMRPGWPRALLAMLATAAVIAMANWSIVALQIGLPLGLDLWGALTKLGLEHARTLLGLVMKGRDWAWLAAGLVAAPWMAR